MHAFNMLLNLLLLLLRLMLLQPARPHQLHRPFKDSNKRKQTLLPPHPIPREAPNGLVSND
jgi:hypothetical protein